MSPNSVLLAPKRSKDKSKTYKAKVVKSNDFAHPVTPGPRPSSRKRPKDQEEEDVILMDDATDPVSPQKPQPPDSPSLPKRVRLIVKAPLPPPIATHPAQMPKPRVFGGSLPRLLSSFALLEEGDEDVIEKKAGVDGSIRRPGDETPITSQALRPKIGITWDEFGESVQEEVEVWKRIRDAKAKGWLGCMRGWEIVRGEEDEEGEEEEDEEVGGDTEVEGEAETRENQERGDQVAGNVDETDLAVPEAAPPSDSILAPLASTHNETSIPTESNEPATVNEGQLQTLVRETIAHETTTQAAVSTPEYKLLPGVLPDLEAYPEAAPPEITTSTLPDVESVPVPLSHVGSSGTATPMALDYPSSSPNMEIVEPAKPLTPAEPVSTGSIVMDTQAKIPVPPTTAPVIQDSTMTSRVPTPIPRAPTPTLPLPLPAPSSHYEKLLVSLPLHAQRVKNGPLLVRHRPARLIARYWEQLQGAADRLAAAEERRVRMGAKAVARGVVAKAWKDAVAVCSNSPVELARC